MVQKQSEKVTASPVYKSVAKSGAQAPVDPAARESEYDLDLKRCREPTDEKEPTNLIVKLH